MLLFGGGLSITTFETLRQKLCEAPILTLPEDVSDFLVYFYASIIGFGVVLMKRGRVIAFASRYLKFHKTNYPTNDLELGEVVFPLKIWRHYLYGIRFTIYMVRWLDVVKHYDCEILYHPSTSKSTWFVES